MPTKLSRFCEGIMEAAWIAAIVLVPVFFNVYSSRIFEPDKITMLRSLALLILGAWVAKLVEEGRPRWQILESGESWFKGLLRIPLLPQSALLALVYIISSIFSVTPSTSLWGSYQRLQGTYTTISYMVIFAAMVGTLRRREQVDRLFTMLILSSLPIAFYGFLQRYSLDPIPWGGNTSTRIAANMGNSIFVAAYMIMVWPLTIGRVIEAFRAILKYEDRLFVFIIRATIYLTIAILQLIAIYFSFSRGPVLGLGASALFLFMLLLMIMVSNHRIRHMIVISVLTLGLLGAAGLLLLNVKNGPLESLRQSPMFGRFSIILNPESNSALVRKYIWEGAANLVAPHAPLQFPDGSTDAFNFLRPLIGYGPESMYVAYNQFYVPDLGHVEKRNASPDRAHNETWDSLVITGAFGFLMYLIVFMSVFYYGLKWLGLVESKAQKLLFWCTTLGGGVVGAGLLIAWGGIEWFGVGLPFGIAIGLVFVYLPLLAFTHYRMPESPAAVARALTMIMLLSAILAHFLEINFGIAIAVTRTYFWVFSALLLLVGMILPRHGIYLDNPVSTSPEPQDPSNPPDAAGALPLPAKSSRRRRAEKATGRSTATRSYAGSWAPWLSEALAGGLLVAVLMAALGYNYVSNANRNTSVLRILGDSLAALPNQNNATSYGIFALAAVTLLVGSLLFASENTSVKDLRGWGKAVGVTLSVGVTGMIIYWFWQAATLAGLASYTPANTDQLIIQVNRIGGLLTNFYVWIFLLLLGLGYLLGRELPAKTKQGGVGWVISAAMLLVVVVLVVRTNLRIVHADITFKMAEPFAKGDTWGLASLLYQHAISQAPDEDYYYLFLGKSYLEQAKTLQDINEKSALVQRAEVDLKSAQKINPLNTDHTANLARLYSWWAGQTTDAVERKTRGEKSSEYYARALVLSPNHSTLWGEWAILFMDLLDQPEAALERLQHAVQLDPEYNFTQGLLGDYYITLASRAQEKSDKTVAFQQAIDYYDAAVRYSVGRDSGSKAQYLLSKGNVYIQWASLDSPPDAARLDLAIQAYLDGLKAGPNASDIWRVDEQISRLYVQKFDKENALSYANQALEKAPETQRDRLSQFIQQIQQLP